MSLDTALSSPSSFTPPQPPRSPSAASSTTPQICVDEVCQIFQRGAPRFQFARNFSCEASAGAVNSRRRKGNSSEGEDLKETIPIKEILTELAETILTNNTCRFNINRASVLDGAVRGFQRQTYNLYHRIMVKFSDDRGMAEEAVDLGGPRREFLRLLMKALQQSEMFEGSEGNLNLALNATALREDRYFVAGRAVAVCLVHGGPPPNFLSKTLFESIVKGPDRCKPVLEDIADFELREKLKRVSESETLEDLKNATGPLQDYLANAGCLRQLTNMSHKERLVEDVLLFQVVNRVRAPFERFRDGLKTLGILSKIQEHPQAFHPILCHQPVHLTADKLDDLFEIQWSVEGSNRRNVECQIVTFWRDFLQDTEEEGPKKLGDILVFATGSNDVPPVGFSPSPSVEFLHDGNGRFPIANTCINCLRLPIHNTYTDFRTNIEFALTNTQGFGME
ncbi:G2/M phase-specific E3 ubiquitin-protein ligase-like [Alosa pseudoharengus]|uniref:G2/M phase-specific E3 ubiquitin-protein ligase-like n=1 Tax=Alosa pseudoharengus TaxID=34774 RepID=UPI003F8C6B1E